jgi:hypothetical protein
MVHTCVVPGCMSNCKGHSPVSVFRFPKEEETKRKWIRAIRREGFEPNANSRVCEVHFKEEDILKHSEVYNEKTGVKLTCKLKTFAE